MHADYRLALLLALSGIFSSVVGAFYIPGYSIRSYEDDEAIPLFVNKVYSDNTQLSFAYYDLPFVYPPQGVRHAGVVSGRSKSLNLGEVLRGDRIIASDYELNMTRDSECQYLGTQRVDRAGVKRARELVEDGYVAEWIVDNLPGATSFVTVDRTRKYYAAGFKLGFKEADPTTGRPRYFLNNHLTLVVRWRPAPGRAGQRGAKAIVGFEVYTKSITSRGRAESGCPRDVHERGADGLELYIAPNNTALASKYPHASYLPESDGADDGAKLAIPYSYSVYFREDARVEWANRWDMYFKNQEESSGIHWLAIANSLVIAGLLTAVVAMVWNRTVCGDLRAVREALSEEGRPLKRRPGRAGTRSGARTPRAGEKGGGSGLLDGIDEADDASDDDDSIAEDVTGWKLLHADVFRTPGYAGLLAPLVGSGTQLVFVAAGLLALSCLGVLNPSFRGGFVSVGFGLFVFAGVFSGYFSGRLYRTFGGKNWRRNTGITALLFPGLLFAATFVLNLLVWAQASSTALPFGTLLALALLWLCIQVPLVYAGSLVGYYRSPAWEHPTKTSGVARPVLPRPWYLRAGPMALTAGLVPFAVIFIELLFVFRSLWQDKSGYYYAFGFLSVVGAVHVVAVVETTIVATYVQLCAEDHRWQWPSFFVGGGSAAWIFLYCAWYYFAKLSIQGFVSGVLFFSYALLACGVYGLLTGTIGFLTAYAFVRKIYGAIKAD